MGTGGDERFVVRDTDDGFEVHDRETGELVAWALERWMAEHWTDELNEAAARRLSPDHPGDGDPPSRA